MKKLPILLRRPEIDDKAWNALLDNSTHPVVYAYTWYLDCVSPGWNALVWPSAQNYEIVMPLPIKEKWGVAVVQQPLFCQYLGLFSRGKISDEAMTVFLESLSRHFQYISVYEFHPRHTPLLRKLLSAHPEFEVMEKATHWLDLGKSYEEVASRYSKDRRKNLRKSLKQEWRYSESEDIDPLIALFRENHAGKIRNVKESAYSTLRAIFHLVLKKHLGGIQYASLRGKIHAGVMFLEKTSTRIYIFNAADAAGRQGNARTYLLDQYFRKYAGRKQIFDFESPESKSIAAFYKSFGAEEQVFISVKKISCRFRYGSCSVGESRFFFIDRAHRAV